MLHALETYRLMLCSRYLDQQEEELHKQGLIDFCVSSAGAEAVAAFPAFMEHDLLFLHYRDRPLMLRQGWKPEELLASAMGRAFSLAGGRNLHPLLVSSARRTFNISGPLGQAPLQAVGAALALKAKTGNAIVLASMGDGTTQQGQVLEALAEAAREAAPVLFLIHNNRWAISCPTSGRTFWHLPDGRLLDEYWGIPISHLDSADLSACSRGLTEAVNRVRSAQQPLIVVLETARIGEHSSADRQETYRDAAELAAERSTQDPLHNLRGLLLDTGQTEQELQALEAEVKCEIELALTVARNFPLPVPELAAAPVCQNLEQPEYAPFAEQGCTMAQALNAVLALQLRQDATVSVRGQDIEDPKGDVLGLTKGLSSCFPGRVCNGPLSEATLVGGGIGRALAGEKPVVMIQFADFLPHAWSQLVCDAASYWWRSGGGTDCPLILLAPYGGYRHGLGPFHSHSLEGALAHVPGLQVFVPSNAPDAAGLLQAAFCSRTPTVLLYPNNLLHASAHYAPADVSGLFVAPGRARHIRSGTDLTLVCWGNTVAICEEAASLLEVAGLPCDLLDLRTVAPWDHTAVLASAQRTGRLLVVHEDTLTAGFGAEVIAWTTTHAPAVACRRVTRSDVLLPANNVNQLALLPSVRSTLQAAAELLELEVSWPENGVVREDMVLVPGHNPADEEILVGKLLVTVGESVTAGQTLAELEGQKASYDFHSPQSGTIAELFVEAGETARPCSPFLRFVSEGQTAAPVALQPTIRKKPQNSGKAVGDSALIAAGIVGTGAYLPEQRLTNEELAARLDVSTNWIYNRTGIHSRRIAAPEQACSDLAIEAARRAMADADAAPEEIGMVIIATSTGDYPTPSTAAIVQHALGIPAAACFDLSAACSGFVYGLMLGCNAVSCGFSRKVLVVGAETLSRIVNPMDKDSVILFGDGAGAVIIGAVPEGYGLLATDVGTTGSDHAAVLIPAGGSRLPTTPETLTEKLQYLRMDGNQVFMFAMRVLGNSALRALEAAGLSVDEIDLFIPHQANRRIIEAAAGRLELPMDKIVINLEQYGNTSAATIPIALHEAWAAERIHHGDRLVLTGFGGGLSWGSTLVRWYAPGVCRAPRGDQIHNEECAA
jgi:2-oxoisovalerate dehydrogenase E1 component